MKSSSFLMHHSFAGGFAVDLSTNEYNRLRALTYNSAPMQSVHDMSHVF